MTNLVPFDFEGREIRVISDERGEPIFVAADVLATLSLDRKALERLDEDEKGVRTLETLGGHQEMTVINESGLYRLTLTSRKDIAKRFKRWVTSEVLPAIRKTGTYSAISTRFATPTSSNDCVSSILLISEAMAKVPGVKPGILAAATLACIQNHTGIIVEGIRRSLPPTDEPICSMNATQLGKLIGVSAKAANCYLADHGLQVRNERDEWELTEAGKAWGKVVRYSRHWNSDNEILWNPAVVEQLLGVTQ